MIEPELKVEDLLDTIVLHVTFKGRSASKCDLVVADLYAKFNLNPYFLIVDFPEPVSPTNVCASAKVNVLTIRVKKDKAMKWPNHPWKFDDIDLKARRDESFQRLITAEKERKEQERIAKEAAEKEAMQRAWDFEKQQRDALKEAKEQEKEYAESLLAGDNSAKELKDRPLYEVQQVAPTRGRQQAIQINHTPTMKDVPARYEGPERNFIIAKTGESSPKWMKEQGDQFFKNGDYRSAINAYTVAVDGSDRQYLAAFSNRAAARLKLGMSKLALNDCEEALKLIPEPILTPEVALMKIRLLSRKTQALFDEKRYVDAFQSCAEIVKYQREDSSLKDDLNLLILLAGEKLKESKAIIEGNVDPPLEIKEVDLNKKNPPKDAVSATSDLVDQIQSESNENAQNQDTGEVSIE